MEELWLAVRAQKSLQISYMAASMVADLEAGQKDAGRMMWKTGLVHLVWSASRWLETEQRADPSGHHHWSFIFRNDEEPTEQIDTDTDIWNSTSAG